VPHGEKQNSFILQLSLAHEYELELLLIVDELEEDDEFVVPFEVELDPNDHRASGFRVDLDLQVSTLKPSPALKS
jgi:hypothetical protein